MKYSSPFFHELLEIHVNDPRNFLPSAIAEIIERFYWTSGPAGAVSFSTLKNEWLNSGDYYKQAVIVSFEELCPVEGTPEGIAKLKDISEKWPDLRPQCEKWITFVEKCIAKSKKSERQ